MRLQHTKISTLLRSRQVCIVNNYFDGTLYTVSREKINVTVFPGCSSVMVARAAQWNLSVFRYIEAPPPLPLPHTLSFVFDRNSVTYPLSYHLHVYTCTQEGGGSPYR